MIEPGPKLLKYIEASIGGQTERRERLVGITDAVYLVHWIGNFLAVVIMALNSGMSTHTRPTIHVTKITPGWNRMQCLHACKHVSKSDNGHEDEYERD